MKMSLEMAKEAHKRIMSFIHKTPVMTCSTIDDMVGRKVYMKCELLQKTGSFKARGALNAVSYILSYIVDFQRVQHIILWDDLSLTCNSALVLY